MFILKTHGSLSFDEMDRLTAEDRAWWVNRIKKYNEEQKAATQPKQQGPGAPPR